MGSSPARKKKKTAAKDPGVAPYRVYWSETENVETVFVDNMFLQIVNDQIYLTFGQMQLPFELDPEKTAAVEIRPMARMVTSPAAMRKIADVLKDGADDYEKREEK